MKNIFLLLLFPLLILCSCDEQTDNSIDKSLISNIDKLTSLNGRFVFYRYQVAGPMAFNGGHTEVVILNEKETFNYKNRDVYRFDNYPFSVKWKNENTLSIKCFTDDTTAVKQPVRNEIKKWKNWVFEIEYYTVCSSGVEGEHDFDSYFISGDNLIIKTKSDSFLFKRNEIEILLDSNHVHLSEFKLDTTNCRNSGLALSDYDFIKRNINDNYSFLNQQAFIRIKL